MDDERFITSTRSFEDEDVENTLDNFNDQLDDINTNLTIIEGKLTDVKK